MKVLVLQHAECEPLAAYQDELEDRAVDIHMIELDRGDRLPSWEGFDAFIAMGGPMSANDEDAFEWLSEEKRLIRDSVEAHKPFWGVCLGAQLLAGSLGAQVYAGPSPEVGILPVAVGQDGTSDPVFSSLPREFLTLQWHGDTFELPAGATLLASSLAYRHQAFRWRRAYGVQFHLEVSPELAEQWGAIPAYARALDEAMGPGSLGRLLQELTEQRDAMRSHALVLFRRWLDVVVNPSIVEKALAP